MTGHEGIIIVTYYCDLSETKESPIREGKRPGDIRQPKGIKDLRNTSSWFLNKKTEICKSAFKKFILKLQLS